MFPQNLSQPIPRQVEIKGIVFASVALGLILAVALPRFLNYDSYRQFKMDAALASRGVTTTGTLESLVQTPKFRNSHTLERIRYDFRAGSDPFVGVAWVTEAFYSSLSAKPEIEVRYDPANPEISKPVYPGMEAARSPELKATIVWSAFADLGLLILLVGVPIRIARRDWRLLRSGVATRAKIVSEAAGTGRGGDYLALSYEFVDEAGRTVRGRRVLWGELKPGGGPSDPKIRAALRNPTVIYDRDDSDVHLLYPSSLVEIRG